MSPEPTTSPVETVADAVPEARYVADEPETEARHLAEETAPDQPTRRGKKRYWSWLVAVIALALLVAGGYLALYLSNSVAINDYADRVASGDGLGTITIPRLGGTVVPIGEGTDRATLRTGVGWYDTTARPGQVGNCAIAGHRLGWGQPFADLGLLAVGDEIQITVGDTTYTYRVITGPTVVPGDQTDVLAPVPTNPDQLATKALLTLTTAATLLPSPDRLIVIAELQR